MLSMLSCGFRVTFGCVFGALVWVSGDLRVPFGCLSGAPVWVSGEFRVSLSGGATANAYSTVIIFGCAPFGPLEF